MDAYRAGIAFVARRAAAVRPAVARPLAALLPLSKYELNPHESSALPRVAAVQVDPGDVAVVLRALALAWTPRHRN